MNVFEKYVFREAISKKKYIKALGRAADNRL